MCNTSFPVLRFVNGLVDSKPPPQFSYQKEVNGSVAVNVRFTFKLSAKSHQLWLFIKSSVAINANGSTTRTPPNIPSRWPVQGLANVLYRVVAGWATHFPFSFRPVDFFKPSMT